MGWGLQQYPGSEDPVTGGGTWTPDPPEAGGSLSEWVLQPVQVGSKNGALQINQLKKKSFSLISALAAVLAEW